MAKIAKALRKELKALMQSTPETRRRRVMQVSIHYHPAYDGSEPHAYVVVWRSNHERHWYKYSYHNVTKTNFNRLLKLIQEA